MNILYVDFDETLVASHSFHYLYAIRKKAISLGPKPAMTLWFLLMMALAPFLILSHFISGALRDHLSYFFYRGLSESMIRQLAEEFFRQNPKLLRRPLVEWLQTKKKEGFKILIVSGSVAPIVEAALQAYQLDGLFDHLLTTELAFSKGVAQGRLKGPAMVGKSKVLAVRAFEGRNTIGQRLVLTDSMSDRPLLEIASEAIVINPKSTLRRYAQDHNWRIWDLPPVP